MKLRPDPARDTALLIVSLLFSTVGSSSGVEDQRKPRPTTETAGTPTDVARRLGDTFATVAERVSPAVVVVHLARQPERGLEGELDPHGLPDLFEFFQRSPRRAPQMPEPEDSQGSGFLVRADGYIYTNSHVIQGAQKITVTLKDGRKFDARVIGIPDERTDVAVIKIDAENLPTVEIGDSDLIRPGEWTIAIGAPFNLDYSVTVGVLSGKIRDPVGAGAYAEYLQTQATINPGNSGGPLLDIDGKVIGINTLIRVRQGASLSYYNANVGFAIPIKLAHKIGTTLITKGKVERPWIGVGIQSLEEAAELKDAIKGVTQGVLVKEIPQGTPAHSAGLKPADVITTVDGVPVATARELQKQILEKQIGQSLKLEIVRDGKSRTVEVETALQPNSPELVLSSLRSPPEAMENYQGMTVQALTNELASEHSLSERQGLLIMEVRDNSPAARAGLIPGMVITEVDQSRVSNPGELKESLRKADPRRGVVVQVSIGSVRRFAVLHPTREERPPSER